MSLNFYALPSSHSGCVCLLFLFAVWSVLLIHGMKNPLVFYGSSCLVQTSGFLTKSHPRPLVPFFPQPIAATFPQTPFTHEPHHMYTPSCEIVAMSPVRIQPSSVIASRVFSSSPQYPSMTLYPRVSNSPAWPVCVGESEAQAHTSSLSCVTFLCPTTYTHSPTQRTPGEGCGGCRGGQP